MKDIFTQEFLFFLAVLIVCVITGAIVLVSGYRTLKIERQNKDLYENIRDGK